LSLAQQGDGDSFTDLVLGFQQDFQVSNSLQAVPVSVNLSLIRASPTNGRAFSMIPFTTQQLF
jgi:hypothetical protein